MTQGLNDIFGGDEQYIEEIIILPYRGEPFRTGTVRCPAGYVWTDFEYIEFSMDNAGNHQQYNLQRLPKEVIAANPTGWTMHSWIDASYSAGITAASATTAVVSSSVGNMGFVLIKAYLKRYSTKNISKIVNVNSGANVAVNTRYQLDIATELGADYVGKDLIVIAQLYINGVWAENGLESVYVQSSADFRYQGVDAQQIGDKIHVITGGYGATQNGSDYLLYNGQSNHFLSLVNVTSAPCRIKVWKVDQFITNTAGSGGGGKTTLYAGPVVENGSSVPLSDSIAKYDMLKLTIQFNSTSTNTQTGTVMVDPDEILDTSNLYTALWGYAAGSNYVYSRVLSASSSVTSLRVSAIDSGYTNTGISKVVGINYSS